MKPADNIEEFLKEMASRLKKQMPKVRKQIKLY